MKSQYNLDEIQQFWTGLMEGDGSIQVNHWRRKILQSRFVIKLKYTEANYHMLKLIQSKIGGTVKENRTGKHEVVWVANDSKHIAEIFKKYPPLTTRIFCQLEFLNTCLQHGLSIEEYFIKRELKFVPRTELAERRNNQILELPEHFNIWLSGFTEAEGCFSIRQQLSHSYSIGQKTDRYILEAIKNFFNMPSKVREASKDFWIIETANKQILKKVIQHFDTYPLMGEKAIQFKNFKKLL